MNAPNVIRVIVDKDGSPVDAYDAEEESLDHVRRMRKWHATNEPDRAPYAIATYELRKKPGEMRAVIRLR